jgi:hypothetical protein
MINLLFLFVAFIIGENKLDLLHLCHVLLGSVSVVGGIPRFVVDGKIAKNPTRISKISMKFERCDKGFFENSSRFMT